MYPTDPQNIILNQSSCLLFYSAPAFCLFLYVVVVVIFHMQISWYCCCCYLKIYILFWCFFYVALIDHKLHRGAKITKIIKDIQKISLEFDRFYVEIDGERHYIVYIHIYRTYQTVLYTLYSLLYHIILYYTILYTVSTTLTIHI